MNSDEKPLAGEIITPQEYLEHPIVQRAIRQFLGTDEPSLSNVSPQYLAIGHAEKKGRRSPASSIHPDELPHWIQHQSGNIEIHASLWQHDHPENQNHPRRAIMLFDIEYYNNQNPLLWLQYQEKAYELMEPSLSLLTQKLDSFTIPYLIILTGRGFHVITAVSGNTDTMDALIELGDIKEASVIETHNSIPERSKRKIIVPSHAEAAHIGMCRLQQYVINSVIDKARTLSRIRIEISDRYDEGIAFDNTARLYTVDTRTHGIVGSPYFLKLQKSGQNPIRLFRAPFNPNQDSLSELIQRRTSPRELIAMIKNRDVSIPDASASIYSLIETYKASSLYKFHQQIDQMILQEHQPVVPIEQYIQQITDEEKRNYAWDLFNYPQIRMLNPDELDTFIWSIYSADNSSFESLRSLYNYLKNLYTGNLAHELGRHYDPSRRAVGWLETIIGQQYELRSSAS